MHNFGSKIEKTTAKAAKQTKPRRIANETLRQAKIVTVSMRTAMCARKTIAWATSTRRCMERGSNYFYAIYRYHISRCAICEIRVQPTAVVCRRREKVAHRIFIAKNSSSRTRLAHTHTHDLVSWLWDRFGSQRHGSTGNSETIYRRKLVTVHRSTSTNRTKHRTGRHQRQRKCFEMQRDDDIIVSVRCRKWI